MINTAEGELLYNYFKRYCEHTGKWKTHREDRAINTSSSAMREMCGTLHPYECTYNVSKENYVCTIFAVLITLYVNSQLNGFHKQMVSMIIVFMNKRETILLRKKFLKARHRVV